ncbi:MAG: type transport system ATP-binding protein [Pseudonocardiales bacterium]|jgi:ABC-2 type transport system ATP-binding protein|nr:type transport system ATP-binding protein [Pseudonocardiales bacterium]
MVNSAISCDRLTVVRGGTTVLDGIDVAVREAAITGLLGPSGCGKTTMMRAIIGTQRITSGTVTVLGRPAGHAVLRQEVGYASQQASVYNDLTVAQNVAYFAVAVRAPSDDLERVIDAVDLGRFRDRLTGTLSGGQRSRVSLAVAMLGSPRLLVLDEPTVGLDPVLREDLWSLFSDLAKGGLTLLVSSHVMDEAERCDELLLMREGRVLTQDTPAALMKRTGTDRMDAAFLRLISEAEAAA